MSFNKFLQISITILALFNGLSVRAAELFFEPKTQELGLEQQFQVDLMLDTEDQGINAVEGKIVFPADLLELKEIRDGDSIVNLWVERPSLKEEGLIIFSGVIPGGFEGILSPYYEGGRPGKIFSLIFQARNEGSGIIEISDAKVLLHDGKGTPAELRIKNYELRILKEIPIFETPILEIEDAEPPEDFKLEIARNLNIFDGKWFLVFATQDKGSGISHYEILEKGQKGSLQRLLQEEKWQTGESPYLLKDQKLKSYIYVKAIDRAGNERIVVVEPRYPMRWYENWINWIIIIVGLVIISYLIKRFLWRK